MAWKIVERPGYLGKKRGEVFASYDNRFGMRKWELRWKFGDLTLPFYNEGEISACQVYEDGYFEFLAIKPKLLEKLVTTASDVWDTAESNVDSGLDYGRQETANTHIHDIAIRRAVARLGKKFSGDKLVQVRSSDDYWWILSPCMVPFHEPDMILEDPHAVLGEMKDYGGKGKWWLKKGIAGSVEEWYQNNKILQVLT